MQCCVPSSGTRTVFQYGNTRADLVSSSCADPACVSTYLDDYATAGNAEACVLPNVRRFFLSILLEYLSF